jgi:two-component system LytT family sensor kinase
MKIKWLWFLAGYFLFYLLVNFSFALPNEYNGIPITMLLRNSSRNAWWQAADIFLWLAVSLMPYLILLYFYPKKRKLCFLLLVILIPVTFLLRFYCERLLANFPISLNVYLFKNSYFLVCFNLYPVIFFFVRYAQYKGLQAKELMIESRESQLSFLRSQVNPHFLFNSLNNIYSLVYNKSEHALPAIAGLADILRYTLYDTAEPVALIKEIDYINKYIDLQNLRYDNPVNVKFQVSGDAKHVNFPPLLFLPFIENAFKHGKINSEDEVLEVSIQTNEQRTVFHCRNKKSKDEKDSGQGIGIKNVKRRLELLYPGKHVLDIKEDELCFDVNLTIVHE